MSVLLEPKKSFQEFCEWFEKEPIWHKIQIENVTARDTGNIKKNLVGNRSKMTDIYEHWYLARLV